MKFSRHNAMVSCLYIVQVQKWQLSLSFKSYRRLVTNCLSTWCYCAWNEIVFYMSSCKTVYRHWHVYKPLLQVMMRVSYTEVSSCGRKVDIGDYFAYIAG